MKRRKNFFGILLISSVSAFSQEKAEISSFVDLVETVREHDESFDQEPIAGLVDAVISVDESAILPEELSEIVRDYYSETVVPDDVPVDVLSYVEDIFTLHGYHENGSWVRKPNFMRYVPYKGKLPEYDYKDFKLPVLGRVTSGYGYRPRFGRHHRGIDIALNSGDTVRSALPGVVVKTGYEHKGYGCYIMLAHAGSVETVYAHLDRSLVIPGQLVEAGEPLGIGGTTGNSTGAHLHFETRYLGVAIDPVSWFNTGDGDGDETLLR